MPRHRFGLKLLIMSALLFLAVIAGNGMASAQEIYDSKAPHAILIDARTGRVIYEKNADSAIPPASMSKLMTMIMVFEQLKAGKLSLDQEFVISKDAWKRGGASSGGSTMYAELNSSVKLNDLIQGVIVQSANDACIAIAEALAGSEPSFAEKMTARAHELGATNATFRNATGLPDPEHKMSVRDLSVMARHIITNFPEYYKYYSIPEFTWNKIRQLNRNPLLKDYQGADGMKTGYTRESGYGLVGSASRDGRRLIMVIAGLKSINERKQEAQNLLDWGFSQFRPIDVYGKGERVGKARVWGGTARKVDLVTSEAVRISLSPQEQDLIETKLAYQGPLIAPVAAGTKVGSVRFVVDGIVVADVPVEAASSVDVKESMWSRAVDSVYIMIFGS
jgi:serine-type D-Ala-D-Ala carboxypeptidase (penicillin-binding protein 5/6)